MTPDVLSQKAEVRTRQDHLLRACLSERRTPTFIVQQTLCDVLVVLRELCFSVPDLAFRLSSEALVLWLFGMLWKAPLFDHAVGLIEELLADQPQTLDLALVPDLQPLLLSLSLRQLAHLCRVLALLVFEPEDRHMMESSKVLRSVEILQLRRDRMVCINPAIDRNQALLLGMPLLLGRLVKLLKVVNHGPPLLELSHTGMVAHLHVPPLEVLLMLGGSVHGMHDWARLDGLHDLAAQAPPQPQPQPLAGANAEADASSQAPAPGAGAGAGTGMGGAGVEAGGGLGAMVRGMPVAELMNLLAPLLSSPTPSELNVRQIVQLVQTMQALHGQQDGNNGPPNPVTPIVLQRLSRRHTPRTPAEAVNELQFNALLLIPHQVGRNSVRHTRPHAPPCLDRVCVPR
jgi:hypothetical protein